MPRQRPLPALLAVALLSTSLGQAPAAWAAPKPAAKTTATPTAHVEPVRLLMGPAGQARLRFAETDKFKGPEGTTQLRLNARNGIAALHSSYNLDLHSKGAAYMDLSPEHQLLTATFTMGADLLAGVLMDGHLNLNRRGGHTDVEGRLALDTPVSRKDIGFSSIAFSGTSTGNLRADGSETQLTMQGDILETKLPINSLDLRFSESDSLTSFTSFVEVLSTSEEAKKLKLELADPAKATERLKAVLQQAGFHVKEARLEHVALSDTVDRYEVLVEVDNFRQTIKAGAAFLAQVGASNMGHGKGYKPLDVARLQQAIDHILDLNVDEADIHATRQGSNLAVTTSFHVSNFDRFLEGYLDLYDQLIGMLDDTRPFTHEKRQSLDRLSLRVARHQIESLLKALPAIVDQFQGSETRFSARLDADDTHSVVAATLHGRSDAPNLVENLRTAGLAVLDAESIALSAGVHDKQLQADVRITADGAWYDALRNLYADTAATLPGLETFGNALRSFQFRDARISARIVDGRLETQGLVQTSDMGPLMSAVMRQFVPQLPGDVSGLQVDLISSTDHRLHVKSDVWLTNLASTSAGTLRDLLHRWTHLPVLLETGGSVGATSPPDVAAPVVDLPAELQGR